MFRALSVGKLITYPWPYHQCPDVMGPNHVANDLHSVGSVRGHCKTVRGSRPRQTCCANANMFGSNTSSIGANHCCLFESSCIVP